MKKQKTKTKRLEISKFWPLLFIFSSCKTIEPLNQDPIKVWVGDSESRAMYRKQDPLDDVKCESERFNKMVCIQLDDFNKIIRRLNKCD